MSRDLVVLSHLRWVFVWQRPQHLVSRLAAGYERTWFVEEPVAVPGLAAPRLRSEEAGPVVRVWLEVPGDASHVGFDAPEAAAYPQMVMDALGTSAPTVWLYTPLARDVARALGPSLLVYDVMDDLASFRFAPPGLVLAQRQVLREADVVFAGGRSLHRGVADRCPSGAHCFPSGVEPEHFAQALRLRAPRPRPVAGYVGVIDERVDLDLVAGLAGALPDWDVQMVGPTLKIDPSDLPRTGNLHYPGPRPYEELPAVLAGFDVALMPFALNDATRSISPTKTLEYLAAGLPVVSTRVPDVEADYSGVVDLCDDVGAFAEACRAALDACPKERARAVRPVLERQRWDAIAERMGVIIEARRADRAAAGASA